MVEPTNLTSLYTAIAIMDTIGGIIAGPLLALTFNAGLKLGGQWIGLPFLIVSVFFLGVGCVIFMVQLPEWMGETARGKGHDAGEAREGEEERLL
jgi:predicted membrane channel-forming protein YqfA (hemolysin III family)